MGGSTLRRLLNDGSGTLSLTGDMSLAQSTSFEASSADIELLGVLSGGGGAAFAAAGAGRAIVLGGAHTFTGVASVGGLGVVKASVLADSGMASSLGAGSAVTLNGTMSYAGAAASSNRAWSASNNSATILNDGTGALTLNGTMSLASNLTLGGSFLGADNILSGVISGSGNLISSGDATWVLTGANTRSGTITVNGGTLRAGSATGFGALTGVTVNGGTLDLNGFDLTAPSLTGAGGIVALGGSNLSVNLGSGINNTYAGSITGASGTLTKLGPGTLTLTGASTYSGATTIGGGTLALDFSPAGGPTSGIISASSPLVMTGGALAVKGAAGEANTQDFAGLTITAGNNIVSATSGSSAGSSLTLGLGAITRTGGLANFALPSLGTITTTNADGVLGGWATVNGTDYAKVQGGDIVAFTAADYVNNDDASTWLNNEILSDAGNAANTPFFGTVGSSIQVGGLQYTAAANSIVTVTGGATLGVDGTIIVAPSVGSANQTISGGSMTGTLGGGTLGIQQNGTGTFTIASTIANNTGVVGFTKAGAGRVVLSGANTYSGATIVAQGTLSIGTVADAGMASAIGMASADSANLVIEGATLEYTGGTSSTDRGFTIARSGAITASTIAVTGAAANLTISGQVLSPDAAGFIKAGPGTLTLANTSNSYSGITTVSGGTLAVATLANGNANSSIGNSSNDSSNLVLQTTGVLNYLGGTTSTDRGFTLASGVGGIGVDNAATTLTVSGTATGAGSLSKTGPGTLILSGTNNYTGGTTVSAGTLQAGSPSAFGTGAMNVLAGATLDLANIDNTLRSLNGAGDVTLGTAMLTISGGSGNFSGVISGAASAGVTLTSVDQTFSGCGNTYGGATVLWGSGSRLNVSCLADGGQASDIGAATNASANLVFNGGTLQYTGGDVSIDRGFQLTGNGIITVSNAASTLQIGGMATGAGRLYKRGSGTLVLSGTNNDYTGGSQVDAGILRAGSIGAMGSGPLVTANVAGALIDLDSFDTSALTLAGGGTTGGDIALGSATLTVTHGSGQIFSGAITGTGSLVKNGAGVQTLAGCGNSYGGGTTINGGTLAVSCLTDGGTLSSIGESSAAASNLVLNGGTLQYTGTGGSTDRQFTLGANGGALDASGTGAIAFSNVAAVTLAGTGNRTLTLTGTNSDNNSLSARLDNPTVGGTTSLTKNGTGTWILNNSDGTYTGVTTIAGGVLGVDKLTNGGEASSIGMSSNAASNLVIGSGSTLRYTGAGDTTDRLFRLSTGISIIESSGTGAIVFSNTGSASYQGNGNRTLALGGTNTGLNTMGGTIIDGPGGTTTVAKNGSGTWVLTGNNTFTGNTVVNDGNLIIGDGGNSGNAGAGNVIVATATSTLSFNRGDTFNFAGTLSGDGSIAQIGNGTTVLTALGNQIEATTISAGRLQVNGGLITPTIAMTGTSALTVNGAVQGTGGGATATLTGDAGASTITINAGGLLSANGNLGGGNDMVVVSGVLDTGVARLNLGDGDDMFVLGDGGVLMGAGVDGDAGTDTLRVATTAGRTLDGTSITNFEALDKQGSGTLTLAGNHSYSNGTTIAGGTLQIGNGATAGALATPTVTNNGTLAFNLNTDYSFAGAISGTGVVNKNGTGVTTLIGANSYSGATNVNAGILLVNGNQSGATGATNVAAGATLGGTGTIGGDVTVANGGRLSPGGAGNQPGTFTINGSLSLGNGSVLDVNFGQAGVVGGAYNDVINVGDNLTLDGTLNVTQTPGGTFGPGVYRIFNYGGTLVDAGLDVTDPNYFVQTSDANQVNLVNSMGLALSFWDGDAGPQSNSIIDGGNGTWRSTGDQNWTDVTGLYAAPFDNASFAIFQGTAGTVGVDNTSGQVQALGMQFAANGYVVTGGSIVLVPDGSSQSTIRVGDGSGASAGYTATIDPDLSGTTRLVKTDLGTLVLNGTNSFTGGTSINGGTVRISRNINLGDTSGGLALDGGTLRTTASFASARGVTVGAGGGTFDTQNLTTLMLNGTVDGAGALTKAGAGTLVLNGTNSYQGGTVINGGTVETSVNANLGAASGGLTFNDGTLHTTGTFTAARNVTLNAGGGIFDTDALTALTLANAISGAGALIKDSGGTLVLAADNNYAGGTTIAGGVMRLGTGGATGSIVGDVSNNGTLIFDRNNSYSFAGLISGTGGLEQIGIGGTTILTADNSYTGNAFVRAGTLIVNGDQSAATGATTVETGGAIGGIGVIGGDVTVHDGGALNPGDAGVVPGTLTINGSLTLGATAALNYNFGQAGVVGGAYNDLTIVHGALVLDGTMNVTETPGGNFGPGLYRVISYDGALTNNGLTTTSPNHVVQTAVAGQVNLVDISGVTLNFWDGNGGPKANDLVDGGSGTWRAAGDDNWTNETGDVNAAFSNGSFAIFAGTAGTVGVDNANGQVQAAGMQFATDGYRIEGGAIELLGPESIIRVGDGTAPGAGYLATIASVLEGNSKLIKTDLGTLVLAGANTYTSGTEIRQGTLQISSDANLGDAAGGITLDGGMLWSTASVTSARTVTLNIGNGTFRTDAGLTLSGLIDGGGGLTKAGTAALTLTGDNTYAGTTTISAGAFYVNGDQRGATGPTSVAAGATLGGTGTIGGSVTVANGGILAPGDADGTPGTLALAGNLTLNSASVLNYKFGEANAAGGALNDLVTVGGNLTLDGTLNVSVSPGGTFGPGIYRVFSYDGALTNNGLTVGTIPSTGYFIQTAIANQVNLVNTAGMTFNYWDGDAGPKLDGTINGGDGVWQSSAGNDNWTNDTGTINGGFADASFAVFAGKAGTVTVYNGLGQVAASGMQFMTDGYVLQGGTVELAGPSATIHVGDGTNAGDPCRLQDHTCRGGRPFAGVRPECLG
jgi:fibronectin-binding autotransporter adhesin